MAKAAIIALVVVFLIFYIVTSPAQAADIVHGIWNLAVSVAHGIGNFFDQLAS